MSVLKETVFQKFVLIVGNFKNILMGEHSTVQKRSSHLHVFRVTLLQLLLQELNVTFVPCMVTLRELLKLCVVPPKPKLTCLAKIDPARVQVPPVTAITRQKPTVFEAPSTKQRFAFRLTWLTGLPFHCTKKLAVYVWGFVFKANTAEMIDIYFIY